MVLEMSRHDAHLNRVLPREQSDDAERVSWGGKRNEESQVHSDEWVEAKEE